LAEDEATVCGADFSIVRDSTCGFAIGEVRGPICALVCGFLAFWSVLDRNLASTDFDIALSGANAVTFRRTLAGLDLLKVLVLTVFLPALFGRARATFARADAPTLEALRRRLCTAAFSRVLVTPALFRGRRALVSALARAPRFFAAEGSPVARFRADRAAEVARFVFAVVFVALEFLALLLDFLRVVIVTLSTRDRPPSCLPNPCATIFPSSGGSASSRHSTPCEPEISGRALGLTC
jgi:hypothetical protein